jgi:hypothetical protein
MRPAKDGRNVLLLLQIFCSRWRFVVGGFRSCGVGAAFGTTLTCAPRLRRSGDQNVKRTPI